jgi:hypothetical protein
MKFYFMLETVILWHRTAGCEDEPWVRNVVLPKKSSGGKQTDRFGGLILLSYLTRFFRLEGLTLDVQVVNRRPCAKAPISIQSNVLPFNSDLTLESFLGYNQQ